MADNNSIDKDSSHKERNEHIAYDSNVPVSSKIHLDKKLPVKKSNVLPKKSVQSSVVLVGPEISKAIFPESDSFKHDQNIDNHIEKQKGMNVLDDEFNQHENQKENSLHKSDSVVVTNQQRDEMEKLIHEQLHGKLSEDQIIIVQQVTNSYLDVLFKQLLKRAMKKFISHVVLLIFEEVRLKEKEDQALTDQDLFVICHQIYDQELKNQATKEKAYVERKSLLKK